MTFEKDVNFSIVRNTIIFTKKYKSETKKKTDCIDQQIIVKILVNFQQEAHVDIFQRDSINLWFDNFFN